MNLNYQMPWNLSNGNYVWASSKMSLTASWKTEHGTSVTNRLLTPSFFHLISSSRSIEVAKVIPQFFIPEFFALFNFQSSLELEENLYALLYFKEMVLFENYHRVFDSLSNQSYFFQSCDFQAIPTNLGKCQDATLYGIRTVFDLW